MRLEISSFYGEVRPISRVGVYRLCGISLEVYYGEL